MMKNAPLTKFSLKLIDVMNRGTSARVADGYLPMLAVPDHHVRLQTRFIHWQGYNGQGLRLSHTSKLRRHDLVLCELELALIGESALLRASSNQSIQRAGASHRQAQPSLELYQVVVHAGALYSLNGRLSEQAITQELAVRAPAHCIGFLRNRAQEELASLRLPQIPMQAYWDTEPNPDNAEQLIFVGA